MVTGIQASSWTWNKNVLPTIVSLQVQVVSRYRCYIRMMETSASVTTWIVTTASHFNPCQNGTSPFFSSSNHFPNSFTRDQARNCVYHRILPAWPDTTRHCNRNCISSRLHRCCSLRSNRFDPPSRPQPIQHPVQHPATEWRHPGCINTTIWILHGIFNRNVRRQSSWCVTTPISLSFSSIPCS